MPNRALSIDLSDSRRFAGLSGDSNPLHVDPVAARRLMFGTTVVHGVDVLMRALDYAFERLGGGALRSLKVTFAAPLRTGTEASIGTDAPAPGRLTMTVTSGGKTIQTIVASLAETEDGWPDPGLTPISGSVQCRDLGFDALAESSGSVPLALDPTIAAELYPALARSLPPLQFATLLATTRIVGMECPGLHSVYTGLELMFSPPLVPAEPHLRYRVAKADRRFQLLSLAVEGPGVSGTIDTMVRPAPVDQIRMTEVMNRVPNGRFSGRKALVIGGSRGLGETAAKILAAGGAEIWVTYARGRADAERVIDEIRTTGVSPCGCCEWDVTNPPTRRPAEIPADWQPGDIHFFASPRIALNPGAPWNPAVFEDFCDYYVTGLARSMASVDAIFGTAGQPLGLFWPSTVFLETPVPGAAEYIAAKGAGEALCRQLAAVRRGLTVATPRLPRMLTDQTAGVKASSMPSPIDVLLESIR